MKVLLRTLILFVCVFIFSTRMSAQTTDWQLIHKGNRSFTEREYNGAGVYYNRAIQQNGSNARAIYNLANVKLAQSKLNEALKLYLDAAKQEKSKLVRSMAYHNRGYVYQSMANASTDATQRQNNLKAAINEYKQALRENPLSDGTRYNLALCQKQLKDEKTPQGGQQPQGEQQQPTPQGQQKKKQQAPDKQSENQDDPLMNYARQAEQRTREKLNRQSYQRSLKKNW